MADAQSELDLLKRVIKLQTENDDMITQARKEQAELKARIAKLEQGVTVLKKELRFKKNRKFQTKCIQIAEEILNEEPIIEYQVQGSQHRFHNTSWYKDIKKLEDIVWYDEKPEIVIPQRIQKIKEFINQVSKGVDMWQINVEINKAYYSICGNTTSTDQKHFVE
ncbi:hypothetical protein Glove_168g327 [Diversispora epigaea]|uniref:Uncharacterized protein n=1 Tax=Diversispora epigaea TaxID=1348612 RepID=A0A397IW19_9GLOM|nr:hypothetical protein Glove_168g327 [Diversispora epigaea]